MTDNDRMLFRDLYRVLDRDLQLRSDTITAELAAVASRFRRADDPTTRGLAVLLQDLADSILSHNAANRRLRVTVEELGRRLGVRDVDLQ